MSISQEHAVACARAERFLARVAALTPEEWGRLDAVGQRLGGRDVVSRVERAAWIGRMIAASLGRPEAAPVAAAFGLVAELAGDVVGLVRPRRARRGWPRRLPRPEGIRSPEAEARFRYFDRLWAAVPPVGGAPAPALSALGPALVAIFMSTQRSGAAAMQLYAPVEPTIPFATLG